MHSATKYINGHSDVLMGLRKQITMNTMIVSKNTNTVLALYHHHLIVI